MTGFLLALVLISLACAGLLAVGGLRGRDAANPWWLSLAAVDLVLTFHVLGFYLPNVIWVPWLGLAATLICTVPASLRERDLWLQELTPQPQNRGRYFEMALFFVAIFGAQTLQPSLPQAHRVALVVIAFLPLFLARWAATRLAKG